MGIQNCALRETRGSNMSALETANPPDVERVWHQIVSLDAACFESAVDSASLGGSSFDGYKGRAGDVGAQTGTGLKAPNENGAIGQSDGFSEPLHDRGARSAKNGKVEGVENRPLSLKDGVPQKEDKPKPKNSSLLETGLADASMPLFRSEFATSLLTSPYLDPLQSHLGLDESSIGQSKTGSLVASKASGGGGSRMGGQGAVAMFAGPAFSGPGGPPPGYFAALAADDANKSGLAKSGGGNFGDAVIDFERAVALNPLNPEYAENLSRANAGKAATESQLVKRQQEDAQVCNPKQMAPARIATYK